jgi:hypothetical protein
MGRGTRLARGLAALSAGVLAGGVFIFAAGAQTAQPEGGGGVGGAPAGSGVAAPLPAPLMLGERLLRIQGAATVSDTVVIVGDAPSYLAAISAWSPTRRFPVLIDDGSERAREDIARFVRGFAARRVVRWSVKGAEGEVGEKEAPPVVLDPPSFARLEASQAWGTVAGAWGMAVTEEKPATEEAMAAHWRAKGHKPPGVVVVATGDRAWTAGVALAAGWGQPLIFATPAGGMVDHSWAPQQADALAAAVERACEASGWTWRGLGDEIEAVTLAMNVPSRIDKGGNEFLALTDRVGRLGTGLNAQARWAWCGQVFGDAARGAYMAMCSLFLKPGGAWIFDGYPDTPPWNVYGGAKAAEVAGQVGLTEVEVISPPRGGAHDWRLRVGSPVTAGLVMVNTKGNADFFDLEPGRCVPGDVPILGVPAALHMVHSWSLLFPGKRELLGGRWIDRGVYAYCGSVHEPFLSAFTPTPVAVGRLMSGAPVGAAWRLDQGPMWKITIIGDPLHVALGRPLRDSQEPALGGETGSAPTSVDAGLRGLLTGGEFERAFVAMALCGRDADIARLAAALLDDRERAATVDSRAALAAVYPAFRAGRGELIVPLMARMNPPEQAAARDALWLWAYPRLGDPQDVAMLDMLRQNVRPEQIEQDARVLAAAWSTRFGSAAVAGLFEQLRGAFAGEAQRTELEKARARPGVWGR